MCVHGSPRAPLLPPALGLSKIPPRLTLGLQGGNCEPSLNLGAGDDGWPNLSEAAEVIHEPGQDPWGVGMQEGLETLPGGVGMQEGMEPLPTTSQCRAGLHGLGWGCAPGYWARLWAT